MNIVLLLLLGLCIGIVGGMVGIGGGVLLIPTLTTLFPQNTHRWAAGMTLAVLSLPVALPGAWQYVAHGILSRKDLWLAAALAVTFAVGTYSGGWLQMRVDVSTLRLFFGLLLLYVGVRSIAFTNHETYSAAAGLVAVAAGWLAFFGLRALGRRHLPPDLGQSIRDASGQEPPGHDQYYI